MVKSDGPYSFVFGVGASPLDGKRLVNNISKSLMIGFNSARPTLFISTAPTSFGYNKTGRIAIGNVVDENGQMDPQAKLHLRADEGEEAAVFIEPHVWEANSKAILYLGTKKNSIQASFDYGISFLSTGNYLFPRGNVGIGTSDPKANLDVEGTLRVGSFANNPGFHKIVFADQEGVLFTDNIPLYDDMGNCVAENDIVTNGHWIKYSEQDDEKGIYLSNENKIGIGTSLPRATLDIVAEEETHVIAYSSRGGKAGYWAANKTYAYGLEVDNDGTGHITANMNTPQNIMNFYANGKVSIGNARPNNGTSHRLFVEGGITSEEVVINVLNENREWPDYGL